MNLEVCFLNTLKGDFTSDFDLAGEQGRKDLAALIEDMTRRGYALFLEEGGETYRIQMYWPDLNEFEVRSNLRKPATVRINARAPEPPPPDAAAMAADQPAAPAPRRGRPGSAPRVTAVAPVAGG